MADKKTCMAHMWSKGFNAKCGKPAKFKVLFSSGDVRGYACGIHAKRYEKIEMIGNENS